MNSRSPVLQGEGTKTRKDRSALIALGIFLVPTMLVMTFIVVIPLIGVIISSVMDSKGFSLANYTEFFGDRYYLGVMLNTAVTGIMAAVISLLVGYPCALYLRFGPHLSRRYIALIIISPLLVSGVVRAFALTLLIGPKNPIELLIQHVVPGAQMNLLFTRAGVLIGLVYTLAPFMILSLVSNMSSIDSRMLSAARSLGASTWIVFSRIVLPLTVPGILSGCFAVFSLSVTTYVTPILLGGSGYKMMAKLISEQILFIFNWPAGYAFSIILLVFNGCLLAASAIMVRRLVKNKALTSK